MSAWRSPVCGRAWAMLSILTAITGPGAATGSPVNGDSSLGLAAGSAAGLRLFPEVSNSPAVRAIAGAATTAAMMTLRRFRIMISERRDGRCPPHAPRLVR